MASMEPLLICCLMAHRSRKNGSPTVSWVDRGCQWLRPSLPGPHCLPALPPYSSSQASGAPLLPTSTNTFMAACLVSFWILVPFPQPPEVSMDSKVQHQWLRAGSFISSSQQSFQVSSSLPRLREQVTSPGSPSRKRQRWTWTLDWLTPCDFLLSLPR